MLRATLSAILLLSSAGNAFAQAAPPKPGKVVSKVHQPIGTPHKASSFAPRHSNKRVYGDPIQAPIVHSAPAPK